MERLPREILTTVGERLIGSDLTAFLQAVAPVTGRPINALTVREVFNVQLHAYTGGVDFVITTWGIHDIPIVAEYAGDIDGPVSYLNKLLLPDTNPTQADLVATGWFQNGFRTGQWVITGRVLTSYPARDPQLPPIDVVYFVREVGDYTNGYPTGLWHATYANALGDDPVIQVYAMPTGGLVYTVANWWQLPLAARREPMRELAVKVIETSFEPVVKFYNNRLRFVLTAANTRIVVNSTEYTKDAIGEWAVSGYDPVDGDGEIIFPDTPAIRPYAELFTDVIGSAPTGWVKPAIGYGHVAHTWFYPKLLSAIQGPLVNTSVADVPFSPIQLMMVDPESLVHYGIDNHYQMSDSTGQTVVWSIKNGFHKRYATGHLDENGAPTGMWRYFTEVVAYDGTFVQIIEYGQINRYKLQGRWRVVLSTDTTQYQYELALDVAGEPNGTVWITVSDRARGEITATGLGLFDFGIPRGTWVLVSGNSATILWYVEQLNHSTAVAAKIDIAYGLDGAGPVDSLTYREWDITRVNHGTQSNPLALRLPSGFF